MINTRRLAGDDWRIHRDLQLAALLDEPDTALVTHAQAALRVETDWRQRLSDQVQFVALVGGEPVGTGGALLREDPELPQLVSMWVAPEARGTGVGDQLVRTVLDWARGAGYRRIALWVLDGNKIAERLYERHGFTRTGQRAAMARDAALVEVEMVLELD